MSIVKRYPLLLSVVVFLVVAVVIYVVLVSYRHPIAYTTSYIEIVEIGQDRQPWAIVKNPYDHNAVPFKLNLDTNNTRNLLVVGQMYLASYETNIGTKKSVLNEIKQPAQPSDSKRAE